MNLFNIGSIINKFNKLQKEVDSYCESQRKEAENIQAKLTQANADLRKGEYISKALKAITGEE